MFDAAYWQPPTQARRDDPEAQVQRAIIKACRLRGIVAFHVPNEGQRSRNGHQRAKRDGLVVGIPDLILIRRGTPAAMEVKRPGWKAPSPPAAGKPASKAWLEWEGRLEVHDWLRRAGCPVVVVTSLDEAEAALRRWGWL